MIGRADGRSSNDFNIDLSKAGETFTDVNQWLVIRSRFFFLHFRRRVFEKKALRSTFGCGYCIDWIPVSDAIDAHMDRLRRTRSPIWMRPRKRRPLTAKISLTKMWRISRQFVNQWRSQLIIWSRKGSLRFRKRFHSNQPSGCRRLSPKTISPLLVNSTVSSWNFSLWMAENN